VQINAKIKLSIGHNYLKIHNQFESPLRHQNYKKGRNQQWMRPFYLAGGFFTGYDGRVPNEISAKPL